MITIITTMPKRRRHSSESALVSSSEKSSCLLSAVITSMIHSMLDRALSFHTAVIPLKVGYNAFLRIDVTDRMKDVVVEYDYRPHDNVRLSLSGRFLCEMNSICEFHYDSGDNYASGTNEYLTDLLGIEIDSDDYEAPFNYKIASCTVPLPSPMEFVKLPYDFVYAYMLANSMRTCSDCHNIRDISLCTKCMVEAKQFALVECSMCRRKNVVHEQVRKCSDCHMFVCLVCKDNGHHCPFCKKKK